MDFTQRNNRNSKDAARSTTYDAGLRSYMLTVYNYMALALAITGLVAFGTSQSESLMAAIHGTALRYVVMFAPLGLVIFLAARVQKMSFAAAQMSFWVYSAIMGLSLSYIFLAFTGASIAKTFFITATMFGAMSLYGYTTKKDLSGFGSLLIMGVFGIILASIVNMFMQSSALQFAISIIGVLIFTGLTAYDTQKIKKTYYQVAGTGEAAGKAAIMGALSLYLDFINLMIMLLQLLGDRR